MKATTKYLMIPLVLFQMSFNCSVLAHCQQVKLSASDADANDRLGVSVAIVGLTAVIGAYQNDSNGLDSGAAYVFELMDAGWTELQKLTPSDGAAGDNFGRAVAVDGNTIVVGSHLDDNIGADSGSAYVFTRSGGIWSQQQKLAPYDAAAGDKFGFSVTIDNNTIIVGAYRDNSETGAAYVFTKTGPTWTQQQKLTALDANEGDLFGYSVAINNDTAIVGAYWDDYSGFNNAGSAYVFTYNGSSWTQVAVLRTLDPNRNDLFGCYVALDVNYAVIGAYECDINGVSNAGAAYVFEKTDTGWIQRQKLFNAVNPNEGDDFGRTVAVEGNTVLVGCPNYYFDDQSTGAVFLFVRQGQFWLQQNLLAADDSDANDQFGLSAGLSGRRIIAGAPYSAVTDPASGSAYIFTFSPADLDRDCYVDFSDFADLAASWLQNEPLKDIAPPPAGDSIVDIYDLALLCSNWLVGN